MPFFTLCAVQQPEIVKWRGNGERRECVPRNFNHIILLLQFSYFLRVLFQDCCCVFSVFTSHRQSKNMCFFSDNTHFFLLIEGSLCIVLCLFTLLYHSYFVRGKVILRFDIVERIWRLKIGIFDG